MKPSELHNIFKPMTILGNVARMTIRPNTVSIQFVWRVMSHVHTMQQSELATDL